MHEGRLPCGDIGEAEGKWGSETGGFEEGWIRRQQKRWQEGQQRLTRVESQPLQGTSNSQRKGAPAAHRKGQKSNIKTRIPRWFCPWKILPPNPKPLLRLRRAKAHQKRAKHQSQNRQEKMMHLPSHIQPTIITLFIALSYTWTTQSKMWRESTKTQ